RLHAMCGLSLHCYSIFFTATPPHEIYTLSLHDALPISRRVAFLRPRIIRAIQHYFDSNGFVEVETPVLHPILGGANARPFSTHQDRKSTRLNSSHVKISYAVFCLKKKNECATSLNKGLYKCVHNVGSTTNGLTRRRSSEKRRISLCIPAFCDGKM